jgi:hypothetical protein
MACGRPGIVHPRFSAARMNTDDNRAGGVHRIDGRVFVIVAIVSFADRRRGRALLSLRAAALLVIVIFVTG